MAALLEVRNLSVTYGHVEAVRDVSLQVEEGEYVSIIGNNGAGKSSTLKAIAGVVKPAGGEIVLDGKPIAGMASYDVVRRGLSMVPEGRLIFADQTVEDNLYLGAYARRGGGRSREVSEDLERMFALFPILEDRREQLAGSLSGGEQQMLALSRGLLSRPRLLMIDEMSLGLAPRVLETLFPVIEMLNREGLAILLVEQLATVALRYAHRSYVMEDSRILLSGPSRELASDERVIESYLGRRKAS